MFADPWEKSIWRAFHKVCKLLLYLVAFTLNPVKRNEHVINRQCITKYMKFILCVPFQAFHFSGTFFLTPKPPSTKKNITVSFSTPQTKTASLLLVFFFPWLRTLSNRKSTNDVLRSWPRRRKPGGHDVSMEPMEKLIDRLGWDDWFCVWVSWVFQKNTNSILKLLPLLYIIYCHTL